MKVQTSETAVLVVFAVTLIGCILAGIPILAALALGYLIFFAYTLNDPGDCLLLCRAYESIGNDFDGISFKLSGVRPYRNSIRNGGDHGRDLHDYGEGDGVQ